MEPVEVEIRMRQNVEEESKKAAKGMADVGSAADQAKREVVESIRIQKQVIKQLKAELDPLSAAFKKANQGTQDPKVYAERKRLLDIVRKLKNEIKLEEKALIDLENQTTKYTAKTKNLETEIRNVRNEMAALKMAGKEESAQYKDLEQRLGILGTAYKELTAKQKALSTGGSQMAGFVSGLTALSGALAAGGGAIGLFNDDSEKMAEIQTKVQSLMAITIGLQQISNTLHVTSAFRVTTVAAAKELWAAANLKVATTLGISNIAAKALMATLTLGLSVAITGLIYLFSKYSSAQKKAAEESKKFNEMVADSAADIMTNYELLRKKYVALGNDLKSKEQLIRDHKKEWDDFGVSINNVNDADSFFITNTDKVKDSIMARAQAIAATQLATEKFKEVLQKQMEFEAQPDKIIVNSRSNINSFSTPKEIDNPLKSKLEKDRKELEKEYTTLLSVIGEYELKAQQSLQGSGLNNEPKDFTHAYWEAEKKQAKAALDAMTDVEKGSDKWNEILKQYNEANTKLETWNFSNKKTDKLKSEKEKADEKLRKMAIDTEQQINAATIAAMQDGANKKLAEVKLEYDRRIAIIKEKRLELDKLEEVVGVPATQQRAQLDTLEDSETEKYNAKTTAINDAAAFEIDRVWMDVETRFRTRLANQLADVDRYYNDQLAKLRGNISDQDKLQKQSALLEKKRLKEKSILKAEAQIADLQFQEELDLRNQELLNRSFTWETDKREALLKIRLDAARKELAKEKEIQLAGGDNADQIELLKQKIKELSKEIENIPSDKFEEVTTVLSNALSQMSAVGGEMGKIFATMASGIESIKTNLDLAGEGSTGDKVSAGIGAAMDIYSMIAGTIEHNKKKQEEWNASIQESVHQARLAKIELEAYKESNVFGIENPYAKAIAGAKQYAEAMEQLQLTAAELENGQVQTGTTKKVSGANVATGVVAGAAIGALFGPIGAAIGAVAGGLIGLLAKKSVPVFESLKSQFGEIYDSETFELNPEILANYNKLDEATKKIVDNWQEIKDKALEAEEQMRQNFKDLAGDIGNSLTNALVDAFRNGDIYAAMDDFHGEMTKIIEDITTQLILAALLDPLLDAATEGMMNSFKEDGDGSIIDDLITLYAGIENILPLIDEGLATAQDMLADMGWDILSPEDTETRSGTSSALAQASQDSIDELSGRILAISRNVAAISIGNVEILGYERAANNYRKIITTQLEVIVTNTGASAIHLRAVEYLLEEINTRGVKIKT